MVELRTWSGKFYEGANFNLLARVVGVDGVLLKQSDFAAPATEPVALKIYSADRAASAVYSQTFTRNETQFTSGGTTVATVNSTPVTGYGWPDTIGFNICVNVQAGDWTVDPIGGQLYRAELELTTLSTSTGVIYVTWKVRCLPIRS